MEIVDRSFLTYSRRSALSAVSLGRGAGKTIGCGMCAPAKAREEAYAERRSELWAVGAPAPSSAPPHAAAARGPFWLRGRDHPQDRVRPALPVPEGRTAYRSGPSAAPECPPHLRPLGSWRVDACAGATQRKHPARCVKLWRFAGRISDKQSAGGHLITRGPRCGAGRASAHAG